jgi:hypothetical protein
MQTWLTKVCARHQLPEERDALRMDDRLRLVAVDCGRRPTHEESLQVWILTAQDRVDANEIPLHIKRLDVMRDSKQVRFRWQLVSRVSPVTAAKEAQLPRGHEGLDAVLDSLKPGCARFGPFRDGLRELRSPGGIGLQGQRDIDPVERVKVVDVNNVILDVLRARGGVGRTQHRLGIPGAILEFEPHQRGLAFRARRVGDGLCAGSWQRQRGGHGAAELHEPLARESSLSTRFQYRFSFGHSAPSCPRCGSLGIYRQTVPLGKKSCM